MKRAARTYSSLVAILVGIAVALASVLSPRILSVVHHYANFIAIGRSSVKIAGTTCNPSFMKRVLSLVRIAAPSGTTTSSLAIGPWIQGTADPLGNMYIRMNSCMPNTLPSLVRGIKSVFPDRVIVLALMR